MLLLMAANTRGHLKGEKLGLLVLRLLQNAIHPGPCIWSLLQLLQHVLRNLPLRDRFTGRGSQPGDTPAMPSKAHRVNCMPLHRCSVFIAFPLYQLQAQVTHAATLQPIQAGMKVYGS